MTALALHGAKASRRLGRRLGIIDDQPDQTDELPRRRRAGFRPEEIGKLDGADEIVAIRVRIPAVLDEKLAILVLGKQPGIAIIVGMEKPLLDIDDDVFGIKQIIKVGHGDLLARAPA